MLGDPTGPWLITGANGLLTSAVARGLHGRGHALLLHVHENTHRIGDLVDSNPSLEADLATAPSRRDFVAAARSHAPLAGLVLGASRFEAAPTGDPGAPAAGPIVERELSAHLELIQGLHRHLVDGGRIVLFSDTGTVLGWPSYGPYLAAKAGLEAATPALARALGPRLVVFCVAPGSLEGAPPPPGSVVRHRTALERLGSPEEVARSVVELCGLPAPVVQGQCFVVDGGRRLYP